MMKQLLRLIIKLIDGMEVISNKVSMARIKLLEWGSIGENVILQPGSKYNCPYNIYIGNDVYIGPGAWISALARCEIKSGVIVGPRLKVYTANHNFKNAESLPYDRDVIKGPVCIGENCWVGGDVIILPGVELGEGCVVGAGSVVVKSFEAGKIIAGNPAKVVGERNMEHYFALKADRKIYMQIKSKS